MRENSVCGVEFVCGIMSSSYVWSCVWCVCVGGVVHMCMCFSVRVLGLCVVYVVCCTCICVGCVCGIWAGKCVLGHKGIFV